MMDLIKREDAVKIGLMLSKHKWKETYVRRVFEEIPSAKTCEDAISREEVLRAIITCESMDSDFTHLYKVIENASSVFPLAENKGEWITKSIETYELPEGQIVVEYDALGVGLISRECMEMLVDTLATNKPKQGKWIIDNEQKTCTCSECNIVWDFSDEDGSSNFCSYCGADMRERKDNE